MTHDGIHVRRYPGERVITDSPSEVFSIPGPPAWMQEANCLSTDSEIFHPEGQGRQHLVDAQKVCRNCSVVDRCLEWALEVGDQHAILGGLSARQRNKLATQRRRDGDGTVRCKVCDTWFPGTPNTFYCSRVCSSEGRRRNAKRRTA